MAMLKWAGYKIERARIVNAAQVGAAHRPRWIAMATRIEGNWQPRGWQMLPELRHTPHTLEAVIKWPDHIHKELQLSQEVIEIHKHKRLLPPNKRKATDQDPIECRAYGKDQVIPTFMATYGRQHKLPMNLLEDKGLLTHWLKEDNGTIRWWHPAEACLLHGIDTPVSLSKSTSQAWTNVGNMISPFHAMEVLANALETIESPHQTPSRLQDAVKMVLDQRVKASNILWIEDDKHIVVWKGTAYRARETLKTCLQYAQALEQIGKQGTIPQGMHIQPPGRLSHNQIDKGTQTRPTDREEDQEKTSVEDKTTETEKIRTDTESEPGDACKNKDREQPEEDKEEKTENEEWQTIGAPDEQDIEDPREERSQKTYAPTQLIQICEKVILAREPKPSYIHCDIQLDLRVVGQLWGPRQNHQEVSRQDEHGRDQRYHVLCAPQDHHPVLYENPVANNIMLLCTRQEIFALKYDSSEPIREQANRFTQTPTQWHTHKARLTDTQKSDGPIIIWDTPMPQGRPQAAIHAEELRETDQYFLRYETTDTLIIHIEGDQSAVNKAKDLWGDILDPVVMQRYGREIGYDFQDKETNIVCRPRQDQPPVPITFLRQYIAERAVQSLMMPLTKEEGKYVTLKYEGEAIWHGHLGEDFQVTPIVNATSQAYKPIIGDAEMRLVYKGATMWEPTSLSAFCATRNIDEEQRMTIHLIPSMRGGVAAKQAQVTRVKNAVATTLMQTGYDLGFVTKVVDQLTQKYGIPKLDALMQSNVNQQGPMLQKIGQEIGIQFPVQVQEAIPTVFKKRQAVPGRAKANPLDPADYTLQPGFFRNQDNTPATAVPAIRPQITGYSLQTPAQAEGWLQANTTISGDELGLVILGTPTHQTTLKAKALEVPAKDTIGREVLLAVTLVQLGDKELKHQLDHNQDVPSAPVAVIAWTSWRDEHDQASWDELGKNPHAALRLALAQEGQAEHLISVWGKSFRAGKQPTTPQEAKSVQVHATVPQDKLAQTLARSGYQNWYCTPKNSEGKTLDEWKVIWIDGNKQQAINTALEHQTGAGLIRTEKSYGVRVPEARYQEVYTERHTRRNPCHQTSKRHGYTR